MGGTKANRAKNRISLAVQVATLDQQVVLHQRGKGCHEPEESTGREMPFHIRRGHWAMQPYGPSQSLRKRILRKPAFVRADLFIGGTNDIQVTVEA